MRQRDAVVAELERVRDALARLRHHHFQINQLFQQVAGFLQRHRKAQG